MRDVHPRKGPEALLQFFHLFFLTNSLTHQYSINQITNKMESIRTFLNAINIKTTNHYSSIS